MPEVKNRKLVFVRKNLQNEVHFTHDFHLDFIPHDMIVRSVSAATEYNEQQGNMIFTVAMAGVGDIFHFVSREQSTPKHIFNINRSIVGQQEFTVIGINGEPLAAYLELIVGLEFIEFYA